MKLRPSNTITDFKTLRNNNFYYVDHTLFIRDIINNHSKINLFTYPQGFGKTINLRTLQNFFTPDTDPALFDTLNITHYPEICSTYMGKLPTIYITLETVSGLTFQSAYNQLLVTLRNTICNYQIDLPSLNTTHNPQYTALKHALYTNPDNINIIDVLTALINLLSARYNQPVILLIDSLDVPLYESSTYGYYNEMHMFLQNILHTVLKNNPNLYFALITSCLTLPQSLVSDLDDVSHITPDNPLFSQHFGFTEGELRDILSYYDIENTYDLIHTWYGGYYFDGIEMYHPRDIMDYISILLINLKTSPENYWRNTAIDDIIIGLANDNNGKHLLENLLNGESIIKEPSSIWDRNNTSHNIWMLYSIGYLTGRIDEIDKNKFKLWIPNKKIYGVFLNAAMILNSNTEFHIDQFCAALILQNASTLQNMLQDYLSSSIIVWNSKFVDTKENFYQKMLVSLLYKQNNWIIKSDLQESPYTIFVITPERIGISIQIQYSGNDCNKCIAKFPTDILLKGFIKYQLIFDKKNCMITLL